MTKKIFTVTDFRKIAKFEREFREMSQSELSAKEFFTQKMTRKRRDALAETCFLLAKMMRYGGLLEHKYIANIIRPQKLLVKSLLTIRHPRKTQKLVEILEKNPKVILKLAKVAKFMIDKKPNGNRKSATK